MISATLFVAALVMCAAAVECLVDEWQQLMQTLKGMHDAA